RSNRSTGFMGPHGFGASHANFVGHGVAAAPAARRPTAASASAAAFRPAVRGGRDAARATADRWTARRRRRGVLRRGDQSLRRWVLLLAAALLRLRPLLRAGHRPPRRHRRLLPLRGIAAAHPGRRDLP